MWEARRLLVPAQLRSKCGFKFQESDSEGFVLGIFKHSNPGCTTKHTKISLRSKVTQIQIRCAYQAMLKLFAEVIKIGFIDSLEKNRLMIN